MDDEQLRIIAELKATLDGARAAIGQLSLLSESGFLSFASDRGIAVTGVNKGEPGEFHAKGLLPSDDIDNAGRPQFHPFRVYPLHRILFMGEFASMDSTSEANAVADLAILLEPLYWHRIVGRLRHASGMSEAQHHEAFVRYQEKLLREIRRLNEPDWREVHKVVRLYAGWMDKNADLYMLLRLSEWARRERLKGAISGALWIRHIAEVIRNGFEEAHGVLWDEEDIIFGQWLPGGRVLTFGSERPLDDPMKSRPYVAHGYGLHTGSAIRWYVEGETELGFINHLLETPGTLGIETLNLKGRVCEGGKSSMLRQLLDEDVKLRRFSILTIDNDVNANNKELRKLAEDDLIVGSINLNKPDFEFANFALDELIEISARFDEDAGCPGDSVRNENWTGTKSGKELEQKYRRVSKRNRPLKCELFGKKLGEWAEEHPIHPVTQKERPILREVFAANWAWNTKYDLERKRFRFDPNTFLKVDRQTGQPAQ